MPSDKSEPCKVFIPDGKYTADDLIDYLMRLREKSHEPTKHWSDCSIYKSMINGDSDDGICTCGYGRFMFTKFPSQHYEKGIYYSSERLDHMEYEAKSPEPRDSEVPQNEKSAREGKIWSEAFDAGIKFQKQQRPAVLSPVAVDPENKHGHT